jgi:hypothetical protein
MQSGIDGAHPPWSPGGEEHWTHKDEGVRLFLWRKHRTDRPRAGVILWIHGSSMASQSVWLSKGRDHVPARTRHVGSSAKPQNVKPTWSNTVHGIHQSVDSISLYE